MASKIYVTRSNQIPTSDLRKPSELADSTSEFRLKDLRALRIEYTNNEETNFFSSKIETSYVYKDSLLMGNKSKNDLLRIWQDDSFSSDLDLEGRTLAEHVSSILIKELASAGKRERITDAFVNYLLGALRFNIFPLSLQLKPDSYFKVHTKTVASEADFGIYKRRIFAIIDEDKHINNIEHSTWWGEYQIAGEILAVAYSNHSSINSVYEHQTIYATRVIGTRFTFYKALITAKYIESLAEGFPEESLYIYRYPSWDYSPGIENIPCLDYSHPDQRKQILNLMAMIRDTVLNNDVIS